MLEEKQVSDREAIPGRQESGFTLIEILIVITIAAIIATIAVPSMYGMTQNNRMTTAVDSLIIDLNLARGEAIKRGRAVAICASTNGSSCNSSSLLNSGWLIFNDVNANGTVDSGESIIRTHESLGSTVNIVYEDTDGTALTSYIAYLATGRTNNLVTTRFRFCDPTTNKLYKKTILEMTGRLTTQEGNGATC